MGVRKMTKMMKNKISKTICKQNINEILEIFLESNQIFIIHDKQILDLLILKIHHLNSLQQKIKATLPGFILIFKILMQLLEDCQMFKDLVYNHNHNNYRTIIFLHFLQWVELLVRKALDIKITWCNLIKLMQMKSVLLKEELIQHHSTIA